VAARVSTQFARGVVAEVETLFAQGVPAGAHAFSGLVYRQIVEMLQGAREEADTRTLIVRENMRYARRQLVWFRKEPHVQWLEGAGESAIVREQAHALVREGLAKVHHDAHDVHEVHELHEGDS
jgi:tRNA dimethylallyltransferase